jgi:hypothetical protein
MNWDRLLGYIDQRIYQAEQRLQFADLWDYQREQEEAAIAAYKDVISYIRKVAK